MNNPSLVVMLGGVSGGPLETLMRRALEASALDTLEVALGTGRFGRALLLADAAPALPVPDGVTVEVDDHPDRPFHYGERLAAAVATHGIERVLYVGGGSGPLLGAEDFVALANGVAGPSAACATNNYFSADLFALHPAGLLARLDPPPVSDNAVPRRLREDLDVEVTELPRTLETQLNIDSPTELLALALAGRIGTRLERVLGEWAPDTSRLARAAMTFTDREAEVLVAGRVGGSRAWQYLERETACRVRILAEERGMQAAGRHLDGSARSMLGQLIGAAGPDRVFGELLPQLCDAAFVDIRPTLIHLGLQPSRADRFAADLGLADDIEDPELRALVAAANAAPIPVVLGGHTLVAGALMLLNDWAWAEHDRARGLA